MKLEKYLMVLAAVLFFIVTLTSPAAAAAKADKELWIVFSVKNIVNPFWKACWVGAQKAAAEYKGYQTDLHLAHGVRQHRRTDEDL